MVKSDIKLNFAWLCKRMLTGLVFCSLGAVSQAQPVLTQTAQDSINVAYGKQASVGSTASISTVSGDILRHGQSSSLSNTLYGRLPGLTVLQGSGEPGFNQSNLLIRGLGTYNNADYLIMVDGFEAVSLDQLSVDEIESVSVLKDAAALALYGMKGANGALLITTKRGVTGQSRVTFNAQTGFQQPGRLPKFVGAYDYARLHNEARENDGLAALYSTSDLASYETGGDPYLYPDVNWYDEVLQDQAPVSDYNFSLSGGNQIAQYFLLLGYLHNDGLYANTDDNRMANSNANYKRYNMRTNVDLQVTPRFSASLDLAGRVEDRSSPNYGTGSLWENMAKYPANAYPVTNPDDSWGGNALYPDNPVASVLDRGFNSSHDRLLTANLKLSQDLLKSPARTLKFSQVLAAHNWHRGNYDRTREYAYYELSPGSGDELVYTQYGTDTEYNTSEGGNDQWNRFNLQLALDFNRNYENQEFSAMLMYHQDVLHVSGNEVPFATQNINGRLNYNYQSRYYAELGLSYSGSERFQKGNRFGFFPALSGAWVISNEEFLENNSTLTFLKARASIGLVGSDRLVGERFAYQQDFYYSGNYRFGNSNNGTSTMMEGALGNPDLTWEKSLKSNIGIEGSLFNNLDFSLDVFYDRRTDILALSGASFPGYVGITPHYENVGSVNNRGFEIDLNYRNTLGGMDYFIGGGTSFSRNEITKMNEITRAEDYLYRTGHSVGQLFGLEAIGFFETGDFDESGNLNSDVPRPGFGPVQPGDIRYADQNNDGFVNENDELAIGKPWEPEINYHFSLGAQYKGFDIDLFFHGIANRDVYLSGPLFWALVDDGNIAPNALDRWTPENSANASYPRLTTLPNENNYRPSDFWTQSGDVLRLRNVEIGYTIPQALASQVQISNARIFFRGSNLFAWDKIESADPENINGYPVLKSYNMGVSLQF